MLFCNKQIIFLCWRYARFDLKVISYSTYLFQRTPSVENAFSSILCGSSTLESYFRSSRKDLSLKKKSAGPNSDQYGGCWILSIFPHHSHSALIQSKFFDWCAFFWMSKNFLSSLMSRGRSFVAIIFFGRISWDKSNEIRGTWHSSVDVDDSWMPALLKSF